MDKTLLSILLILGVSAVALFSMQPHSTKTNSFAEFKATFGRKYADAAEEDYRKTVYLRNLVRIE